MKKVLTVLLAAVITVLCFSVTACEEEIPSVEEVIENMLKAQADVKSYEMEMDADMNLVMDLPEEDMSMGVPNDINVKVTGTSVYDNTNKEMKMEIDADLAAPGEDPIKMSMAMYMVDGWMYMMMDMPMMSPQWMKQDMSDFGYFEQIGSPAYTEAQMEILTSGDAVITGIEKVNGVKCYILEMKVDMAKMMKQITQNPELFSQAMPGFPDGEEMPDFADDEYREMLDIFENVFDDFTMTSWVAKDTYYIMKSNIKLHIDINPQEMGFEDEEGSVVMDITGNALMFNYDKSVSIILPPEAENAVEGLMGF